MTREMNPKDYFERWIQLMPEAESTRSIPLAEEQEFFEQEMEEYISVLDLPVKLKVS